MGTATRCMPWCMLPHLPPQERPQPLYKRFEHDGSPLQYARTHLLLLYALRLLRRSASAVYLPFTGSKPAPATLILASSESLGLGASLWQHGGGGGEWLALEA